MAHTVCGIDLGTFSVKFAFLEVGFRSHHPARPDGDRGPRRGGAAASNASCEAVREGLARDGGRGDPVPGGARRSALGAGARAAVHRPAQDRSGRRLRAGRSDRARHRGRGVRPPGRHAAPEGTTVLAAAAKRDDLAALLAAAEAQNIHPRSLLRRRRSSTGRCSRPWPTAGARAAPATCQAVLDFGHARTNVCIVRGGNAIYARTIRRGGAAPDRRHRPGVQGRSPTRAEQAKRGEASCSAPARRHQPLVVKLDAVLREALAPTVRELRQTLASFRASATLRDRRAAGRGRRRRVWRGCSPFLEAELGIPARFPGGARGHSRAAGRHRPAGSRPSVEEAAPATSEATTRWPARSRWRRRGGSREIDFRRGPFVYRANFSVLRQKAWHLAVLGAALLVAAGADVSAKLSSLGDGAQGPRQGAQDRDAGAVRQAARRRRGGIAQLMRKGYREELAPLPKATAFDLLDQISRKVPARRQGQAGRRRARHPPEEDLHQGDRRLGGRRRRDCRQAEGDRLLRRGHQGGDHRGLGRRQAVLPDHQLEVPVSHP